MGKIYQLAKQYLTQPSTWRGVIGVIIGIFGITLSTESQEAITQALVALGGFGVAAFGAVEVIRNEDKPKPVKPEEPIKVKEVE